MDFRQPEFLTNPIQTKYKLAVFDFDGTLADSFPWFLSIINSLSEKFKFRKVAPEDIGFLRGLNHAQLLKHLGLRFWQIPKISWEVHRQMTQDIRKIRLFPGVDELLRTLAGQHILTAMVTSNSLDNVKAILGSENTRFINHYECLAATFGKHAKLKKILRTSGVKPGETVYFGDETRDIDAAKKAGIMFAGVAWGYHPPQTLRHYAPIAIVRCMADIVEFTVTGKTHHYDF